VEAEAFVSTFRRALLLLFLFFPPPPPLWPDLIKLPVECLLGRGSATITLFHISGFLDFIVSPQRRAVWCGMNGEHRTKKVIKRQLPGGRNF